MLPQISVRETDGVTELDVDSGRWWCGHHRFVRMLLRIVCNRGIWQPPLLECGVVLNRHLRWTECDNDAGGESVGLMVEKHHPYAQVQAGPNGDDALRIGD